MFILIKFIAPPSQGPLSPTLRRGEQTRWGGINYTFFNIQDY